jgi:hypothetical protein
MAIVPRAGVAHEPGGPEARPDLGSEVKRFMWA